MKKPVNPKADDGLLIVETLNGVDYFFCCDGCLTTFRQDPAKYALGTPRS